MEFFPVLLELAGDGAAARSGIMPSAHSLPVLPETGHSWRRTRNCDDSGGVVGQFLNPQVVARWNGKHKYARTPARLHLQPAGPLDRPAARRMAEELLLGAAGRMGEVTESNPARPGWWRFTLRTSVTEHIDVCEATGEFSYVPYY